MKYKKLKICIENIKFTLAQTECKQLKICIKV